MVTKEIPVEFWETLQAKRLIEVKFFSNLQPVFENRK
jgi:hypothetical protein